MKMKIALTDGQWVIRNGRAIVSRDRNLADAIVSIPGMADLDKLSLAKVNDGIYHRVKRRLNL